jgi:hypothetical protein
MYSISALSDAAIRRSLSFSSLRSEMESTMLSTPLKSRCRICAWQSQVGWLKIIICDWQSEGGFLIFISDAHSLVLAFRRLQRLLKFAPTRQNQKLHPVATNL